MVKHDVLMMKMWICYSPSHSPGCEHRALSIGIQCSFISARKAKIHYGLERGGYAEWNIFSLTGWEEAATIAVNAARRLCVCVGESAVNARRKIVAETESENVFAISVSNVACSLATRLTELRRALHHSAQLFLSQLCRRFRLAFTELIPVGFSLFAFFFRFFSFSFSFCVRVRVAIYICSFHCFFFIALLVYFSTVHSFSPGEL